MMLGLISYALMGVVSSFHIGNSLMNDGLGNYVTSGGTRTYGIEGIADLYGHNDYVMSMHIDSSQSMQSIWNNPSGVGVIDEKRDPYGAYTNALLNYHWDHVLLEPYLGQTAKFGTEKAAMENFINLTRQNPANHDTVFYVYQVWPRQSWGNYSAYWLGPWTENDLTLVQPRRQFYDAFMDWANDTYDPQGIVVREIPVGEVWHRINLMIESGAITGITTADLYRDDLHASGPLGRYLAAATNYAVMFQTNINGLVPPVAQFGTSYPPELYEIFNEVIWEVVTSDSDTGIADFNDDGYVSNTDLTIWKNAFGVSSAGDTDGDGDTDGQDFLNWQRNYGGEPPALNIASSITVPEPSGAAITVMGILGRVCCRWRSRLCNRRRTH
jgi:hypothetical protein